MAGYCPGPAVVNLGLGVREGSVFLAAIARWHGAVSLVHLAHGRTLEGVAQE